MLCVWVVMNRNELQGHKGWWFYSSRTPQVLTVLQKVCQSWKVRRVIVVACFHTHCSCRLKEKELSKSLVRSQVTSTVDFTIDLIVKERNFWSQITLTLKQNLWSWSHLNWSWSMSLQWYDRIHSNGNIECEKISLLGLQMSSDT